MLTKNEVRKLLPRVGDDCWEVPTITEGNGYATKLQRGVVVEVNPAHLWYTVEFADGIRESFKLPKQDRASKEDAYK